ncbi:VanZ family protein [Deefgea piscis]|uniref:VanZ family protein n=1 Tax=Deefgea piscis TaxID=2739061 RepID=UPI001C7EE145|nr:VanZ family protein [Deefgea piscis]QZA79637.1 VanZ family protein [Deefgea piscis]
MKHSANKPYLRLAFYLWMAGIWIGSLIPLGPPSGNHGDKIEHFIGYAVLAGLGQLIWQQPRRAWLLASLMGVAVEFAQACTTWRSFDLYDMLANAIGAAIGTILAYLFLRRTQAS